MQAALEAALAAQLRGGALSVPLQEAFTNAFQRTLVPAFEAACQSMFAQAGLLPSKGIQAMCLLNPKNLGRYTCLSLLVDDKADSVETTYLRDGKGGRRPWNTPFKVPFLGKIVP